MDMFSTSARWLAAALAAATLLAGCESMSEDQCRRADWMQQGERDGRQGEPLGRIDAHREACAKAGVTPNALRWEQGWRRGVVSYCTPRTAWSEGARNQSYRGACRDLDEPMFLRWHRLGTDIYKARGQRDAIQRDIDRAEAQLKKAEKEDERKQLRDRIRNLDQDKARVRRLIETLELGAPR
jgi:flagellar motility protein MotE (MotC chaperone)